MRTLAFALFVLVTATAAITGTLAASRYLSLEKELSEVKYQLEETLRVRKAQEEEKMQLRLERERIQTELETRLSDQKAQLDDCTAQNLRYSQEILGGIISLNKRLTDMAVQAAPSAAAEPAPQPETQPQATDVRKGAVPTPDQEAKKLDKVQ